MYTIITLLMKCTQMLTLEIYKMLCRKKWMKLKTGCSLVIERYKIKLPNKSQ